MTTYVDYVSFAEATGYGLSAQANMLALLDMGVEVCWLPLFRSPQGLTPLSDSTHCRELERLKENHAGAGFFTMMPRTWEQSLFDRADAVIHHVVPEVWESHLHRNSVNIGYTVWETDRLPAHWPRLCKPMKRILVPSEFSKNTFSRAIPQDRVNVAQLGFTIMNEVCINQVVFSLQDTDGRPDEERLARIMTRVQEGGRTWFGPTKWRGRNACRMSICSAATSQRDLETALKAIRRAIDEDKQQSGFQRLAPGQRGGEPGRTCTPPW